ncbi:alpha/beta fold hydrolase [Nonomuraea dietziae]|uniref:alpha/beta fold hydrolase n=1 Tax=Nonomuraea dietziae TaxID=65515 RepID=UPI00340F4F21
MGEPIDVNGTRMWVERRGRGPDVLLIAGLSDPAEAWQAQLDGLADRYRLIAFDNRGAGRTPLPQGPLSVPLMADDAAALLRALDVPAALWVYTPRAHADGTVERMIEEALAFPHQQSVEAFQRQFEAFETHETLDRLPEIAVPTLVLAGEIDRATPPLLGREVAEGISGAVFEVLAGEAHQPFQEVPDEFNARVDAFWREVDGRG